MLSELQAEVIVALADNNLNVSECSRKVFMHRNTVEYHLSKIRRTTGKDPTKFYDMCDLLPIAKSILQKE